MSTAATSYSLNDQGAIVDESGNTIVDAEDDSGTGQTPATLVALGYSPASVAAMAGSISPNESGSTPAATALSSGGTVTSNGNSSWLSGLSQVFGSVGTTITNVTRAATNSSINPQTGVKYGTNPATGLPYTTSQTGQVSILVIVVVLVVGWLLLKA